jgi:hypothetical protein
MTPSPQHLLPMVLATLLLASACATSGPGDDTTYYDPDSPLDDGDDEAKGDDLSPPGSSSGQAPATVPQCGDQRCDEGEDVSCPSDCGMTTQSPTCGNDMCDAGEDPTSCPQDCATQAPAVCGNGTCDAGEDATSCPQDCATQTPATCGNTVCDAGETVQTCPQDCYGQSGGGSSGGGGSSCAHSPCDTGAPLQSSCDPCVAAICVFDDVCCNQTWDIFCVGEALLACSC